MSTSVVEADWLPPDERTRDLDEDYEAGPIALNDPSSGLDYQVWHLTYDIGSGQFTVTPETSGSPSVVLTVAGVTQCSLAFDQNGHVTIAYTENGQAKMYWYDTVLAGWTTLVLPFGAVTPTICMDDKRDTQLTANDIQLFYTLPSGGGYALKNREQRDRFLIEYDMIASSPQYIYKQGMHEGLRLQLGLSDVVL